jgi:hypothetical protein
MVGTTGLATLVSPTIQLLAPSGLRMLPGDPQPLALTVHPPHLPTTSKESSGYDIVGIACARHHQQLLHYIVIVQLYSRNDMGQTSSAAVALYSNSSAVLDFCLSKSSGTVLGIQLPVRRKYSTKLGVLRSTTDIGILIACFIYYNLGFIPFFDFRLHVPSFLISVCLVILGMCGG